jgi:hypothetical protein
MLVVAVGMWAQKPDRVEGGRGRGAIETAPVADASTTQQRIQTESWWPTMSTAPLAAYVGSKGCIQCHAYESSSNRTSMQRAASTAANAALLRQVSSMDGKQGTDFSQPPFLYSLHLNDAVVEYSLTDGSGNATQRLDWVMGAGDLGQTFVYERDDRWYQSRMSAYVNPPKLDVTTGLGVDRSADLIAALGKALSPEEVRHCFSCHTVHATTSEGFNPLHAEAGVGCEACHGPGAMHATKMGKAVGSGGGAALAIFNPARLSPADSIDFCGACHRTFGDVTQAANSANDSSVVRFQPYRLEKSRCWRETQDARLTCVACHDPHEPLNRNDVSYDKQCLSCHSIGNSGKHAAAICPTGATEKCVSCHMPKVKVASMHGEFTDHFIRVVKAGEGFVQ